MSRDLWFLIPHLPPIRESKFGNTLKPHMEALASMHLIEVQAAPGASADLTYLLPITDHITVHLKENSLDTLHREHDEILQKTVLHLSKHLCRHKKDTTPFEMLSRLVSKAGEQYPVVMGIRFKEDQLDLHLRFKTVDDAVKWVCLNNPEARIVDVQARQASMTVQNLRPGKDHRQVEIRVRPQHGLYTPESFTRWADLCTPS